MTRLTTKQREQLYDHEVEKARAARRGDYPICALCDLPIMPGQQWDASHNKYLPRALGGEIDGIAHRRHNRRWGSVHDVPLIAKAKRIRQKHIGAHRTRFPMSGGQDDPRKRTMSGRVVDRRTGEDWRNRNG